VAGETEIVGGNLPQCRSVEADPNDVDSGSKPDRLGGKPVITRPSYGTAKFLCSPKVITVIAIGRHTKYNKAHQLSDYPKLFVFHMSRIRILVHSPLKVSTEVEECSLPIYDAVWLL
jgi:hypothetical protein